MSLNRLLSQLSKVLVISPSHTHSGKHSDMPQEILRAAKIVDRMTRAHAAQTGAVGLDVGDEKGNKEMIDAPILKQVTPVGICIHSFA
jgi:hypothetical protein